MLLTAQADDFRCLWKPEGNIRLSGPGVRRDDYLTRMWENELKSYEEQYELVATEQATSLAHQKSSS